MIDVLTSTRDGQAGGGGAEGRRRYPLAAARAGLLVARGVASCARRVPALRIFSRPGVVAESPLLFLVAPALHVHPATDTLLHYISPEIEWAVVGIDERWRDGVRAVFRKRPETWSGR